MNSIPTQNRVDRLLAKGRRRLPVAIFLLLAGLVLTCLKLVYPDSVEPSTQKDASLPIGTGTFDVQLNSGGSAK